MTFTDIDKLKSNIYLQKLFISDRIFIGKKNRTVRKSFCNLIIGPKLWNYYYNMINIKKKLSLLIQFIDFKFVLMI